MLGGACIVLYGMIASVGLRTLVSHQVDFTKNRNLCIAAVMLVLSMGGAVIGGQINGGSFSLSGIGLGIISGIILNLILPEAKSRNTARESSRPAAPMLFPIRKSKRVDKINNRTYNK